jgi:hypothetical protein
MRTAIFLKTYPKFVRRTEYTKSISTRRIQRDSTRKGGVCIGLPFPSLDGSVGDCDGKRTCPYCQSTVLLRVRRNEEACCYWSLVHSLATSLKQNSASFVLSWCDTKFMKQFDRSTANGSVRLRRKQYTV